MFAPVPYSSSCTRLVSDTSLLSLYASLWPGHLNHWTCILCILYPLYRAYGACVYSWPCIGSVCDPLVPCIRAVSLVDPSQFRIRVIARGVPLGSFLKLYASPTVSNW